MRSILWHVYSHTFWISAFKSYLWGNRKSKAWSRKSFYVRYWSRISLSRLESKVKLFTHFFFNGDAFLTHIRVVALYSSSTCVKVRQSRRPNRWALPGLNERSNISRRFSTQMLRTHPGNTLTIKASNGSWHITSSP